MDSDSKTGSSSSAASSSVDPGTDEASQAYRILYQACPYIKLAHFAANQAILEATEAEEKIHVLDLDTRHGWQWPELIRAMTARRSGQPKLLRITAIGFGSPINEVKSCLEEAAREARIPFEFHAIEANLGDLNPSIFHGGEALAVNLVNWPYCSDIGKLLPLIREQAPKIVTLTEKETGSDENFPKFLGEFTGLLRHYTMIFESLEEVFSGVPEARRKVEQIFGAEIRKAVAYGEFKAAESRNEEIERGILLDVDERMKLMEEKGFLRVALGSGRMIEELQRLVTSGYGCSSYTLRQRKGSLLLGWRGTNITATSAWRC